MVVGSRNRGLERSERGERGGIETGGKDRERTQQEGNDGDEQSEGVCYLRRALRGRETKQRVSMRGRLERSERERRT